MNFAIHLSQFLSKLFPSVRFIQKLDTFAQPVSMQERVVCVSGGEENRDIG
jgi:hypothetical protein